MRNPRECYGIIKDISSHRMESFLFELLLRRVVPVTGPKLTNIDADKDVKLPAVLRDIKWSSEDAINPNPITKIPSCSVEEVGQSLWKDGNPPNIQSDKVCNDSIIIT